MIQEIKGCKTGLAKNPNNLYIDKTMPIDQDFKPTMIFNAIRLVGLGLPVSKVARRYELPHHRVRFWVQRYKGLSIQQIASEVENHKPGRKRNVQG